MSRYLPYFLKISIFLLVLSSCVPHKRVVYLQNIADTTRSVKGDKGPEYRIKSGDNLFIQILSSAEKESADYFNMASGANLYYDAAIYLNSYSVSDSGHIELPFVGKIMVKDKTLDEVRKDVHTIVEQYLKQVTIVVKLVNFTVTLLGEVNRPAEYKIYQDKINIFEALAMAGDLTYYAQRDYVLIMRKTDKGLTTKRISLLDDQIINSEYFYLKPNDIIYIQPVKGKNFLFVQFPYTLIFSIITTTLLILNYFN